ncbi:hypothetical protein [uncultured Methylobacterium sp.]|jgi:hypothetical protein|uniref:hypothetical protein n=1 Tax=uncultured Methylobacterium sp. TaxID=157278 RepID=UPI00261FA373|nr:hypothetical protein [uncultured Methylobacterium sp.]
MSNRIETSHIGLMICDLINEHSAAAEGDELPAFAHAHDPAHPVPAGHFETVESHAPEGDYSNLLVSLPNGQNFRVQVFAR